MNSKRDIYKDDVDFVALGKEDEDFFKVIKANGQLDFSDPETVRQLTKALLKRDFGLKISLPDDRLCPPVPNRLKYLLWIQDLLDTTSDSYSDRHDTSREVIGLDIGTGASCIYPLLGCSQYTNWVFAATEIDEKSLRFAKENIASNYLGSRIKLQASTPSSPLITLDDLQIESADFTMCNPPFYASDAEMSDSAALKQRPPNSACTGAPTEMVCPGGEVAFVLQMFSESLILRDRVQWFTSMLGKYSSVAEIIAKLKEVNVDNWAVMEFVQGTRTRRWAVGWSFDDLRPRAGTARGISSLQKHLMPFPSEYVFVVQSKCEATAQNINKAMGELDLQWHWKQSINTGVGFAAKNVWSRAARRRRTLNGISSDTIDIDSEDEMAFGFKIVVELKEEGCEVTIRWLKGRDSVLFESFCGMIKRAISTPSQNMERN